jgi:hypothetical protein
METFDVCVLVFTGLATGLSIGIAIRNKKIRGLQHQIDAADASYARLLDLYMEKFYAQSIEKAREQMPKKQSLKRGPGRPKGSTNKSKKDGGSTTRKYTRKSSK